MPRYKRLSRAEYKKIKALLSLDVLSIAQASKAMKRSYALVHEINKSSDYDDYKARCRARWDRKKQENGEEKETEGQSPQSDTTVDTKAILAEIKEIKKIVIRTDSLLRSAKKGKFRLW